MATAEAYNVRFFSREPASMRFKRTLTKKMQFLRNNWILFFAKNIQSLFNSNKFHEND